MANPVVIPRPPPREPISEATAVHALRLPALPEPSAVAEVVLAFFREEPAHRDAVAEMLRIAFLPTTRH